MINQNLFIVEDNPLMAEGLRNFLEKKFGSELHISTFDNGENVLKAINSDTTIVLLDYDLKGERADQLLKAIKVINPKTEVIILSSNEDIGVAIDTFRKGANQFVVKGKNAQETISYQIFKIITFPAQYLVKEFGVNKFLAYFLLTFASVGIVVFIGMKILK